MSRTTAAIIELTATMVADAPLSVGGLAGDPELDLTIALDGAGHPYVPGTSLAGVLRTLSENHAPEEARERAAVLWGGDLGSWNETPDAPASRIVVHDAPLDLRGRVTGRRHGVGIDRATGTAATRVKYLREVVPAGSTFELRVSAELAEINDAIVLERLADALSADGLTVGAAGTRGLGRCRVQSEVSITERLFTSRANTLAALRGPKGRPASDERPGRRLPKRVEISITWQPDGPLMVKDDIEGLAVDSLPMTTSVVDDDGKPKVAFVLPGAGIKGVLRSHAERILRTIVGTTPGPADTQGTQGFLSQLAAPELELARWLFGAPGEAEPAASAGGADGDETDGDGTGQNEALGDTDGGDASRPSLRPGRAALSVDDCRSELELTVERWAAIAGAKHASDGGPPIELVDALKDAGLDGPQAHGELQMAFHVAIDRWTAAPAENSLFSVLEPHGLAWHPVTMRVDLDRLPDDERNRAIGLLLLVLRDFSDGRLPLGFATNRGMGQVKVEEVLVALPDKEPSSDLDTLIRDHWTWPPEDETEGSTSDE